MSRRETAARRYAEAAFELGRREDSLDAWERDLATLRDTLREPQLRAVAQHPAIPYAAKERVLRSLLGERVGAEPLNLILLMIRRGRPRAVDPMVDRFEELLRRDRGISRAEVRSALALDDEQRAWLGSRLEALTGSRVEMEEHVDASLIGGVAIRVGDTLYDASVRSRLERLRTRLTAVPGGRSGAR